MAKWSPGTEVEYKIELPEGGTPWAVSEVVRGALRRHELLGLVAHLRQEWCRWDYTCHLYEIVGNDVSQGYVSLIPEDGRYQVKEKRFTADGVTRRENVSLGVAIDAVDEYLASRFTGEELRAMPPFRRIRYDVDVESLETGNHFVVSTDLCIVPPSGETLRQCEIEYVDTRSLQPPRVVMSELRALRDAVENLLRGAGLEVRNSVQSKLSFIRQVQAARIARKQAGRDPGPSIPRRQRERAEGSG
jgi:hypothetical protein